jgi:hypothetical protein
MRWDYRRAVAPLALGLVIVLIGRGIDFDGLVAGIAFKLALFAAYPLLLLAIRAVPGDDLAAFRDWLRRRTPVVT